MRIAILTPYYLPEMGAPPARLSELAIRLTAFGHEVTVVTAFPNRPLGEIFTEYQGHRCLVEELDGVRVIRTWIRPSAASDSMLKRSISELSFVLSTAFYGPKLLRRQDVLLVQNPPLFSALSARWLKRMTGAWQVMWCGDIWPDLLLQSGQIKPGFSEKLMRRLQQYGFSGSDLLAVTNPTIAVDTQKAYRCPPVVVWSNGVDTKLFTPEQRSEELRAAMGFAPDDVVIGYVGLHGRFQGLNVIIDAAERLQNRSTIKFLFVGQGVVKAQLQEKSAQLANVTFLDPKPKSEMPALVASCDIALVPLSGPMPGTMPSKFYEAIAAGVMPLVTDGCEAAVLVKEFGVGAVYQAKDPGSVVDAVLRLADAQPEERKIVCKKAQELSLRFDRNKLAGIVNSTLLALVNQEKMPEMEW